MAGKGKQLFDINNLEQAKKIMEQILTVLNKHDPDYAINKAGEELDELYAKLNSLSKEQLKCNNILLNSLNGREKLEKEINGLLADTNKQIKQYNNYVKSQAKATVDIENQVQKQKTLQQLEQNKANIISKEADLQDRVNKLKEKEHQTNKKTAEQEYEKLSKLGQIKVGGEKKYVENRTNQLNTSFDTTFDTMYNNKRQEAMQNGTAFNLNTVDQIASSAREDSTSKLIEEFSDSADKINKGSGIFDTAVKSFENCLNNIFSIFTDGLKQQNSIYEQTYHNISTLTGINQSTYMQKQMSTDNQLGDMGLYDNVKVSEVQEMWNKLATSGVGQEEMFANAIDNVITNKIVPYLDTSTTQWQQLIDMQPNLQKNIRGITEANQEIVGNNYITSDLVQQILDDLQPISDNAMNDIAMETAGATTFINSIMSSMGVDETTAKSIWTEKVKQQKYGGQIMSSGTTAEKYALINTLESGYNLYDAEDTPEILGEIMTSQKELNDIGPGYTNTMNGIIQSRVNNTLGINENMSGYLQGENVDEKIQQAVEDGNLAMQNLEEYAEDATNSLAEGETQTAEQKQTIALQNIMNDVSAIYERMGIFKTIADTIIAGISTFFVGKFLNLITGGKIGTWLGGIFSSSSATSTATGTLTGSSGILAGGAGIAISTAAISAAALAIGGVVADKMWTSSGEHGKNEAEEELAGTELEGNSAASALLATANAEMDAGSFQETFGNVGAGLSMAASNIFQGKADRNKNFLQWAIQSGALNTGDKGTNLGYLFTLAAIYAQNGYLDSFNQGLNEAGIEGISIDSKEEIGQAMIELGMTKEAFETYTKNLLDAGWARINTESGTLTSFDIDAEAFGIEGVNGFRQGLDEVPYDNYPALLHEGEAVLTASTANEMRNLVDEYRDTNEQTVNFDSVIEAQTTSLLAKMDDIISAINNVSSSATAGTSESTGTSSVLRTAMKTLTSTRQYG